MQQTFALQGRFFSTGHQNTPNLPPKHVKTPAITRQNSCQNTSKLLPKGGKTLANLQIEIGHGKRVALDVVFVPSLPFFIFHLIIFNLL